MKNYNLQEMSLDEIVSYNGGNVPMAFYMNDNTIDANGSFMTGFLDGLGRGLGLW